MYPKSKQAHSSKFALSITLVILLLVVSLSMLFQRQVFAFRKEVTDAHDKADNRQDSTVKKSNPFVRFTAEVEKSIEGLKDLEKTLIRGDQPKKQLTQIRRTLQRINKLDKAILDTFAGVRSHCEQAFLPDEVLDRCNAAEENYLATNSIVVSSIKNILTPTHLSDKQVKQKSSVLEKTVKQEDIKMLARVRESLKTLSELHLKRQADFHNSRPTTWEVLKPGEMQYKAYDPNVSTVNVMAAASLESPVLADILPTPDVQMTEEIIADANDLGNSPIAMYEYVKNKFEFQPYYGSRKGSVETLRQRCGNDYDLASLLISMLRSSGIEARYASGVVEIPVERAKKWLGVEDGDVAGSILTTMGLEGMSIIDTGTSEIVAVRCRRVWVEVYVPRGRGGKVWVPMDPAFKLSEINPGLDVPALMGLDAQSFMDEYYDPADSSVTLPREETPIGLLKQQISDYLLLNEIDETVESVKYTTEISPETLGLLPASLPYKVLSRDGSFSEIPANKVYQVRFRIRDGSTNLIDHTVNLPDIAGKRVTIDYVPASAADQATIDSYGGLYSTPPYLVNLKPVLRVGGEDVAVSSVGVGMGMTHESDIHFISPVNGNGMPNNVVPAIYNTMTCGASVAVAIGTSGASENMLQDVPEDDNEGVAQMLYNTAVDYLAMCHNADQEIGSLMHCYVTEDISDAIVENVVKVTYDMFGTPQTFEWVSMRVDADRSVLGIWPVDGEDSGQTKDLMLIGGSEGSLYENRIFEDSYGQDSVSTIKILQLAADAGITIYKRWSTLPLPPNTLSSSARSSIENAIASGKVVTFPADPITAGTPQTGQWTGSGWIDMNPATGAAGYIISGNNNGGVTVDSWPPQFIDLSSGDNTVSSVEIEILEPVMDSPISGDAIFARSDDELITFKYKVIVHYTDGPDKELGPYCRTTHYTTKEFVPGHYIFKIWISKWWFWGTLAEEERKISIVGVFIRADDGSEPPKLLPAKTQGGTVPSEKLKAMVIPEDLSGTFEWTFSNKLKVNSASSPLFTNMTVVEVEPASTDASASLDAEDIDVTFYPTPGPECKTDDPHKMTVYKFEIDKCPNAFIPKGGSEDNQASITAKILPNGLKSKITFELFGVSDENGFCMNAPESLPWNPLAEDGKLFKDLQFRAQAGFNISGLLWKNKAVTDSEVSTATVQINAFDYGAFGKIKAQCKIDSQTLEAVEKGSDKTHTAIPRDDNNNNIADSWAHNAGNAIDDDDNSPAEGVSDGDGLSRFEEFRGFMVSGSHVRTSADNKDAFIHDEDGIGLGYFGTSGLTTHLITLDEFNGASSRIINFRKESHNIVDQHGLLLRDFNLSGAFNWGLANNPAGFVGTPKDYDDIQVDIAQITSDLNAARPPGATNHTNNIHSYIIAHELGHGVHVSHHSPTGSGDPNCVMKYIFNEISAATGNLASWNALTIPNTFTNLAPSNGNCKDKVDVSD